jgi:ankyrin repeat protein
VGELGNESGMTPLHLASYSGKENVVRLLLNSAGVQVEAATTENVHTVIYILYKFSEFIGMQYALNYSGSWSNWLSNSWFIILILVMLASWCCGISLDKSQKILHFRFKKTYTFMKIIKSLPGI